MSVTDSSKGTALTRSGNRVEIGAGVSHVLASLDLMATGGSSGQYFFIRIRRIRGGTPTELAGGLQIFSAGGFNYQCVTTAIPVQPGDTIQAWADISSGTATVNSSYPCSLTVFEI